MIDMQVLLVSGCVMVVFLAFLLLQWSPEVYLEELQ